MKVVDLEDAEQQTAVGGEEINTAGDGEAQQADEDVAATENRGENSVG